MYTSNSILRLRLKEAEHALHAHTCISAPSYDFTMSVIPHAQNKRTCISAAIYSMLQTEPTTHFAYVHVCQRQKPAREPCGHPRASRTYTYIRIMACWRTLWSTPRTSCACMYIRKTLLGDYECAAHAPHARTCISVNTALHIRAVMPNKRALRARTCISACQLAYSFWRKNMRFIHVHVYQPKPPRRKNTCPARASHAYMYISLLLAFRLCCRPTRFARIYVYRPTIRS